ncbi:hypothetical protein ACFE04_011479 [Oxalis oulophora]
MRGMRNEKLHTVVRLPSLTSSTPHACDNKEKGLLLQLGEAGFKGRAKLGLSMLKSPALTFLNPFLKTRSGIDPFSSSSSLLSNLASLWGLNNFIAFYDSEPLRPFY